uniref:LPS-assembly protein LptD n=1 Tax=candidate division WOR-3 bacterium TaxID=2052148 RepID=A0A7V3ZTL2_UNCW3
MLNFFLFFIFGQFKDTIYFKGDSIFYNPEEEKIVLKGNAYIRYRDIELFSDSCTFLRKEELLIAKGNPVLISGKDTLKGSLMRFNIKTQKGFVYKGKSKVEKGFVWGEKIYKTEKKVIKGYTGFFTTCELSEPHYYFTSKKMKVIIDDAVIATPVLMDIEEIPILILPFWVFPISKDRKSGFLIPRPGRNSNLGLYIRDLSYYFVINNYMDLTLNLDLYERKGALFGVDFVYILYKKISGNFKFTYTREIDTKMKRWSLIGNHDQILPLGFNLKARSDFVSDKKYILEYSDIRAQRVKSESESEISLSRSFKIGSFLINSNYKKDFINKIERMNLPKINLTIFQKDLKILRTSASFSYLREIYRDTILKEERSGFMAGNAIGINKIIFDVLNLNANLNTKAGILNKDTTGRNYPFLKSLNLNTSLGTKIYGISIFKIPPFEKFLHTMTISTGYSFAPYIKNPPVKPFLGLGECRRKSILSFNLANDYETKLKNERLHILSFVLSRNYNIIEKEWSNINLNGYLLRTLPFNFSFSLIYYKDEKKWKDLNIYLSGNIPLKILSDFLFNSNVSPWNMNLTYTYKNIGGAKGFLNFNIQGGLTKNFFINFHASYDTERKIFVERSISITRNLHCFSARFNWHRIGNIWDYDFKIWITKIPDVKFERGLFEAILPKE